MYILNENNCPSKNFEPLSTHGTFFIEDVGPMRLHLSSTLKDFGGSLIID